MNRGGARHDRREYRMGARGESVAATRERILRAGYEQWSGRAYDEVSIQSIAEAAGVSRQTVVRQFGTKDELAVAVVDWQRPREDERRATAPGDVRGGLRRLVDRYEEMGDANVRLLALEGRAPGIDHLLEVSRAGHRDWIERTFLPSASQAERDLLGPALYAATDVTVWKLLRRDLGHDRDATEATILRLVEGVLGETRRDEERGGAP